MTEPSFVGELVLLIAMAAGAAAVFERLRLPAIAGFLVIGTVMGPGGFGLVSDVHSVQTIAELGVVFLLFEIGLELPLDRVRRLWRRSVVVGLLQIALTVGGVAGLVVALGGDGGRAIIFGGIAAMSSTALVMRVLSERGEIDAPQGQLSVGILLFQDLTIVPFLLVIPLLAAGGDALGFEALIPVVRAAVALGFMYVVARFLLPRLLGTIVSMGSRDLFSLVAFLVVLGSAWVAEQIGLPLAVGAFVGGLVLSATPFAYQLFAEVLPLRGVLLGIFFTAVGMLLDPQTALEGWSGVLLYVAVVLLLKTAIIAGIVALALNMGWRLGIVTGLGLAQTGEFSFVLAQVASDSGILSDVAHQVFVAGSIVTLMATPYLVRYAPDISRLILGDEAGGGADDGERRGREGHVVLLGFGLSGQTLARVLRSRDIDYLGADANAEAVQRLNARAEPVVYGDITRRALLEHLHVASARLVVITVSDPIATREAVRLVRTLASDVPIVARTHFVLEVDPLYQVGASAVVAEEFESTLAILGVTLRVFGIPDAAIAHFSEELRDEGYEALREPERALDPWLSEVLEEVSAQWLEIDGELPAGASLESLGVRAQTGCSVLAVEHHGSRLPNPPPDQALAYGDRLLALGTPSEVQSLVTLLRSEDQESR